LDTGCQQGVLHKYQKEIEQSINQDICTGIDASYYKGFGVRQGKCRQVVKNDYKIRRLTPRECFRLMDFPDTFTWPVSDSQAYKQAGNSIVVNVLYKILKNLNL
jgi:DNA (cytosine-5)-methyltransferase 1